MTTPDPAAPPTRERARTELAGLALLILGTIGLLVVLWQISPLLAAGTGAVVTILAGLALTTSPPSTGG